MDSWFLRIFCAGAYTGFFYPFRYAGLNVFGLGLERRDGDRIRGQWSLADGACRWCRLWMVDAVYAHGGDGAVW